MKPDPILEELWVVKETLAREAGYDVERFVANLRKWEMEHPQPGRVMGSAEDLRKFVAAEERKRAAASTLSLNEKPPHKD